MQFVSFWNRVYYSLYDFHYFWSEYLLGRILERMHRPFYSSVTQEDNSCTLYHSKYPFSLVRNRRRTGMAGYR